MKITETGATNELRGRVARAAYVSWMTNGDPSMQDYAGEVPRTPLHWVFVADAVIAEVVRSDQVLVGRDDLRAVVEFAICPLNVEEFLDLPGKLRRLAERITPDVLDRLTAALGEPL